MILNVDCIGIGRKVIRASFGIYRYTFNLLNSIQRDQELDVRVRIITDPDCAEDYQELLQDDRFELVQIPRTVETRSNYVRALRKDLAAALRLTESNESAALRTSQGDTQAVLFAPRGFFLSDFPLPVIITVHDTIPWYFWRKNHNPKDYLVWKRIAWSVKRADKVIYVSASTYESVRKFLDSSETAKKSHVCYNAIDVSRLIQSEGDASAFGDYFFTLYSSHIHKGYEKTILAYLEYRNRGGKYGLVVGGASANSFDEQNNIRYISSLQDSELNQCYELCCGFISLSEIEGFGFPPVEAAFFGVPVVISRIPVYYEILSDYSNAFFTNHFLPAEVANTLLDLEQKQQQAKERHAPYPRIFSSFSPEKQKADFWKIVSSAVRLK